MPESFQISDSGERHEFDRGMIRDVDTDKAKPHLVFSGPMFLRWVMHLTNGAKKYDEDNWMKADGVEEMQRFRQSAVRHFLQWYYGERDEDHAAAVFFNINGTEYVRAKLEARHTPDYTQGSDEIEPVWEDEGELVEREHITEGDRCWCEPRVETVPARPDTPDLEDRRAMMEALMARYGVQ